MAIHARELTCQDASCCSDCVMFHVTKYFANSHSKQLEMTPLSKVCVSPLDRLSTTSDSGALSNFSLTRRFDFAY